MSDDALLKSREDFLKEFGHTVIPELMPEMWMDVPKDALEFAPGFLHAIVDGQWEVLTQVVSIGEFEQDDPLSEEYPTVTVTGLMGTRALERAFNFTKNTKFAFTMANRVYEFDGLILSKRETFDNDYSGEMPDLYLSIAVDNMTIREV